MGDIVEIDDSLTFAKRGRDRLAQVVVVSRPAGRSGFPPGRDNSDRFSQQLLPLRCAGASNANGGAFQQPPLNRGQNCRG